MAKRFIFLGTCAFFFIVSCSPKNSSQQDLRWSLRKQGEGSLSPYWKDQVAKGFKQATPLTLGSETVRRWHQELGGVEIDNAWVQTLTNDSGQTVFLIGQTFEDVGSEVMELIHDLQQRQQEIVQRYKARNRELDHAKNIWSPVIRLEPRLSGLEPTLVLKYLTEQEDNVFSVRFGLNGQVLSKTSVAHPLTQGRATVFPQSPANSSLSDVVLNELLGDGKLANNGLRVTSGLGTGAFNANHDFRFPVNHPSFDEAQAFFYANRTLHWFRDNLGFSLPFFLNIKVHVGGLHPSNVAFYYDGSVRLGTGDGRVYQHIVHDPTIVSHEVAHAVIDAVANLPSDGEGGAINEGFADFFAAIINRTPYMASYAYVKASFRRTLEHDLIAPKDFTGGKYHDSTVVSGTLWEIRKLVGEPKAARLALATLARLGPNGVYKDFAPSVEDATEGLFEGKEAAEIQSILLKRGWLFYGEENN